MKKRWYNIFRDGTSFVLALDHGLIMDVASSIPDPGELIREVRRAGVDGFLTTYGTALRFAPQIGNAGLLLRLDVGSTFLHPSASAFEEAALAYTVEDAVRVGADGVVAMAYPGAQDERLQQTARVAAACDRWGLVFGLEVIPGGPAADGMNTLENLGFCCRLASEIGADFVKAPFAGDADSFAEVVAASFVPVLVLGGGQAQAADDVVGLTRKALRAGAKGVILGRNIWRQARVSELCRQIAEACHPGD